ncbi:tRNA1(Val) (adenine(37)-N6)-methyltransferase [Glycocaulis alkaliphilus]|uniref:tRNA1(Val) (adenine(37)-N6)-methyltransferase n=1 Tax=Glycocaulis alkaliphilus TaxID=1434191 RepID=UPI000FD7AAA6|nr:methyltransferase [Glycocaulis alkaliphilus]GGB78795.1 methyltransferase [Glycocaulis alkaliphilus]
MSVAASGEAQLSRSTLHDGRVALDQPVKGYRAGLDAVLLAAALELRPGAHACEFGCGAGAALLCAARLNPEARFTAFEKDQSMAALAAANIALNGGDDRIEVETGDALALAGTARFDAVFSNPPFFDDETALRPPSAEKRGAWISDAPLADWIRAGLKALRPRGQIVLIHRADRLGDILAELQGRAGDIGVLPIHPHAGEPAKRIIVRAVKASRAPLRILPGLIVHGGEGERFTPEAKAVLTGEARLALQSPERRRS